MNTRDHPTCEFSLQLCFVYKLGFPATTEEVKENNVHL
jgi:hypothetical protein